MNFKTIIEGFGAAILIFLLRVWPLLSPRHTAFYHNFLPIQSLVWGVVIDLIVFTLLLAALFTFLEKHEVGPRTLIWAFALAGIAPVLIEDVAAVGQTSLSPRWSQSLFYGSLLLLLCLHRWRPAAYQKAIRGSRFVLLLVGCGLAWMFPQLLYIGLRAQPRDANVPVVSPPVTRNGGLGDGRRIVWILFDELSYRQTFEHRFAGLALPAFDKLKRESISFSDVEPAGFNTEQIVPSLFLGKTVKNLRSNLDGKPSVQLIGQKDWRPFDPQATLFADAQRLGWTSGVVGWYNPYCRLLEGTLNYCFWRAGDGLWSGTTPAHSALSNALAPVLAPILDELPNRPAKPRFSGEEKHASDLNALIPQAIALLRDQKISFVFIHLSVPHPPGIYDRQARRQVAKGTYIDNLSLADQTLGELMAALHATPSADRTTIILCSDHSWRVPLWRPTPQWSEEEETASGGRFDARPVLLVHTPGQQAEQDVAAPFELVHLHEIIEHLLRGQDFGFNHAPAQKSEIAKPQR